jgi:large subunit ribosomal protein L10
MNRQQKSEVVELFKDSFSKNQASFLVGVQGLTVAQIQGLRKELRKQGGTLKVAKSRLMKLAVEQVAGSRDLLPFFKGQVGVVFVAKETPPVAKVLHDYAKTNQALKLVAGCMDERFIDSASIARLAQLPSREVLLAHLCGTLKAPITGLVTVMNGMTLQFLWVLKSIAEQKEQQA